MFHFKCQKNPLNFLWRKKVLNEQFNKTNTPSQNMMFQMCITMPFSLPTMKSAHENIRSNLVNKTVYF